MQASTSISQRKAAGRAELLDVAEQLFSAHGFEGTSPADITAMAAYGRTTFYEYFTDKEDLLACLVEERLPKVYARLLEGIPTDLSPREQLAQLAVRLVEFAVTDHTLGLMLHQELPTLSAATQHRIADAHSDLSQAFARLYRDAVAEGELRMIPPDLAGLFMQDLIMAAAKSLIRSPEPRDRLHEVADELVRFLFHGFSPTEAT